MVRTLTSDAGTGGEHALGRLAKCDRNDALTLSHTLACAQVERDPRPAPVVDLASERDERFGVRVRRNTGFVSVAAVLASHDIPRIYRPQRAEDLVFLFADRARLQRGRRVQ